MVVEEYYWGRFDSVGAEGGAVAASEESYGDFGGFPDIIRATEGVVVVEDFSGRCHRQWGSSSFTPKLLVSSQRIFCTCWRKGLKRGKLCCTEP